MLFEEHYDWLLHRLAPDGDYPAAIAREYDQLRQKPQNRSLGHKHTLCALFLLLGHTNTSIEAAGLDRAWLKKLCRAEITHQIGIVARKAKSDKELSMRLSRQPLYCSGFLLPDLPFSVDEMVEIKGLFSLERAKQEAAIIRAKRAQRQRSAA
jgi:hypothetical protein